MPLTDSTSTDGVQKELCFLGVVSMGPRFYKTIPAAIERCKAANIRLIMVSQVPPFISNCR